MSTIEGKKADQIIIDDVQDIPLPVCKLCKNPIPKDAPIFGDYCERNNEIEYNHQYCFHCRGFASIIRSETLKRIDQVRWLKLTLDLEEDIRQLVYDYKEACAEMQNPKKH